MALLKFCEWLSHTSWSVSLREGTYDYPVLLIIHVLSIALDAFSAGNSGMEREEIEAGERGGEEGEGEGEGEEVEEPDEYDVDGVLGDAVWGPVRATMMMICVKCICSVFELAAWVELRTMFADKVKVTMSFQI